MKLHWSGRSPFVRFVCVAAHERNLFDQLDCVRTVVAMLKPNLELLPENPLSKLPTLVLDDGSALYDSRVITQYFAMIGSGPALYPTEPQARLDALRREALGVGILDFLLLWRSERDKPAERQSAELIAAFHIKIEAALQRLELDRPALQRDGFQADQIVVACALFYLDFRFPQLGWRTDHPDLAAWADRSALRPSMQATLFRDD
ncbi:MAG TPA: glutathione S-transferase family protein [Devosia sp.]|nr:glutathione S-transferase family protein [Devosia sp.]